MRKRTLKKWKERYLISITPIPRVKIRVAFRPDGSWHWDFGHISHKFLVDQGLYYDKEGKYICKVKHYWCGGQDESIESLWRWLKREAYYGNIHPLDLA